MKNILFYFCNNQAHSWLTVAPYPFPCIDNSLVDGNGTTSAAVNQMSVLLMKNILHI